MGANSRTLFTVWAFTFVGRQKLAKKPQYLASIHTDKVVRYICRKPRQIEKQTSLNTIWNSPSYMAMVTNADQRKWRRIRNFRGVDLTASPSHLQLDHLLKTRHCALHVVRGVADFSLQRGLAFSRGRARLRTNIGGCRARCNQQP